MDKKNNTLYNVLESTEYSSTPVLDTGTSEASTRAIAQVYSYSIGIGTYVRREYVQYPVLKVEHVCMSTGEIYKTESIGGNEMVEVPVSAKYLSRADFETEDLGIDNDTLKATVEDEGAIVPASESKWNREQFKIKIKLQTGEERIINLNNTSRELLIAGYGKDSKGWIGKPIVLKGSEEKVAKKLQYVIYARPKGKVDK